MVQAAAGSTGGVDLVSNADSGTHVGMTLVLNPLDVTKPDPPTGMTVTFEAA
jgi:hypothetical protein